jgi:hypothetical protein
MKDLWKNGIVVLLVIGGLYIIFLRECKNERPCLAKDEIAIKKSVWDSIQTLANKPPEVKIDTVYIKGKTVYIQVNTPVAKPDPKDSTINDYTDSIKNKSIDVLVALKVKGSLLNINWEYTPIVTEVLKTETIYVPKIINNPVATPKNGLYVHTTAGGNANSFLFGGGLDFITKKNTEIGYVYQRYGSNNFHSVKLGFKLF